MDAVDRTLKLWRSNPFTWGGCIPHVPGVGDCMLSIGEHVAALGGMDLTGEYRGTYTDEAGAMARVAASGGAVAIFERFGLPECAGKPGRGAVALIDTGDGDGIGGLCTGDAVAMRLERGVIEVTLRFVRVIKAWQCPY